MKKENFERLKKSLEQAIAYEQGKAEAGRITVRERPVKKLRINIMLDEDIIEHFKLRAARPNSAPYQTQINQALREAIVVFKSGNLKGKQRLSALTSKPDPTVDEIADRIAEKVAERLRPKTKRKTSRSQIST